MLGDLFKKTYTRIDDGRRTALRHEVKTKPEAPNGMWRKCKKCGAPIYAEDVRNNYYTCPKCGGYFRIHAYRRIEMICDKGSFAEWNNTMPDYNPLSFPGYEDKMSEAREKTKLDEAIITGRASIGGYACAIAVCDARFMMSSMGHNVGEKITLMIEKAIEEKLPVIMYACSGGARMQEGIVSLMQMAKTSAALKRLHEAGGFYISVLTDPTTGGVTASWAMLGDVILAEPKALIGFAGPRVIAQTIGAKLPEGFQRAEFLLEHGFVDAIVGRDKQRETLTTLLKIHYAGCKSPTERIKNIDADILNKMVPRSSRKEELTAWDSVQLSRRKDRLTAKDYIDALFTDFVELHGDRYYADDPAIIGGVALFDGIPVTVIAQQKGKNLKENKLRNFGMPSPDGYRKALRLMKEAADAKRAVICFVDTPGAYCGLEAEERGQGEAIARNLYEMSALRTPILSILIGEGGSGGALAMAVADEVWVMEHAIYSILSPEGFASILYKDAKRCKEAAEDMKITSNELYKLGIVERVIPEDKPADSDNLFEISMYMKEGIIDFLNRNSSMDVEELISRRYSRFRKY